jgi:hypothetical protein
MSSEEEIESGGIYWDNVANQDWIFFPVCAVLVLVSGLYGFEVARVPHYCLGIAGFTLAATLLLFFFGGVHSRYTVLWTGALSLCTVAEIVDHDFGNLVHTAHSRHQTFAFIIAGVAAAAALAVLTAIYLKRSSESDFEGKMDNTHYAQAVSAFVLWIIGANLVGLWL